MKNKNLSQALIATGAALILSATAFAGVTDSSIKTPASYDTFLPPAAGASYQDAAFGTTIKRITNARGTADDASGGTLTWAMAEYSAPSAFNNDDSRFLLQHDGYFAVYDGNGTFLKDATFEMTANTQPRWSRSDNNVVYYQRGNQLKSFNVATNAVALIHTFAEYGAISGNGESDMSWDGDHMVLVGDGREVFVYTLSSGQKSPVFGTNGNSFDSVYISADNKVTITWSAVGTGRFHGIELFDSNMSFLRQITQAGGHMDMSRDLNGDPVLVWTNANDPSAICQNGIVKVRLSDGQQTCIAGLHLDWSLAVHIAGSDQGWAVVSTYAPADPVPGGNWPAYTDEVFRIKLDGSVVERLAHHRSRPRNSYNWQAWATISRDSSRILYNSNYNLQVLQGAPSEYSDAYMINLGGTTPTATPAPTQAPRVTATSTATATGTATSAPTSTVRPTATPTAATAVTTRLEQTNAAVQLTGSGSWYAQSNAVHSGGSSTQSMDPASDATVTFLGTGITWLGSSDPYSGQADVYLDGALKMTVDAYSATERNQYALYAASGLAAGTHTLRVHPRGTRNAASGGAWVWVDAFDVTTGGAPATATATATTRPTVTATSTPTATATRTATATATRTATATATIAPTATATSAPVTTRVEESNAAVTYAGAWYPNVAAVHSGGRATGSMDAAGQARLTFTGTGIRWIGYRDEWSGIARVLIDGAAAGTVDTYGKPGGAQQVLFGRTGLATGTHVITVVATGTRSAASGGAWVWVDAFEVVR